MVPRIITNGSGESAKKNAINILRLKPVYSKRQMIHLRINFSYGTKSSVETQMQKNKEKGKKNKKLWTDFAKLKFSFP